MSNGIQTISQHASECKGKCSIIRESIREGLASVLEVTCDNCPEKFSIESSSKITGSGEIKKIQHKRRSSMGSDVNRGGGRSASVKLWFH